MHRASRIRIARPENFNQSIWNVTRGLRSGAFQTAIRNEVHAAEYLKKQGGQYLTDAELQAVEVPFIIRPRKYDPKDGKNRSRKDAAKTTMEYNASKTEIATPVKYLWRDWSDRFPGVGKVTADCVLMLGALNQNLVEQDFVRAMVNEHFSGFHLLRIIPLRSRYNLEKKDQFLILFNSPFSVEKRQKYLDHLARLNTKFTMSSLSHPVVPPQEGYSVHGIQINRVVKSFTLVPAGSKITMNTSSELEEKKAAIVHQGGYLGLVDANGNKRPAVLLKVIGFKAMQAWDILQAILHDGESRNMHWNIITEAPPLPTSMPGCTTTPCPSDPKYTISQFFNGYRLRTHVRLPSISEILVPHDPLQARVQAAQKAHEGHRWIVYLDRTREAGQFARAWNARSFPLPGVEDTRWKFSPEVAEVQARDKGFQPRIEAEVLW